MSALLLEQANAAARFDRLELEMEAPPVAEMQRHGQWPEQRGEQGTELDAAAELMPDTEAHLCVKRIAAAQHRIAEIDRLAKQMKAEVVTDLKGFLDNFDRTTRLKGWRAANATKARKKVTTFEGELSATTVAAKCVVEDAGLAMPWLKEHAPAAVVEKIVATKLPEPVSGFDENGEITWKTPGPGLKAEPEREELTVNGKRLDVLLRGKTEGTNDDE